MSVLCISSLLIDIPNPFPSSTPPPFISIRIEHNIWSYCLLRSLQTTRTSGPLYHEPYYRPFSSLHHGGIQPPFLTSTDHVYEWRDSSLKPLAIIHITVNPLFHFISPQVISSTHYNYCCPVYHIIWWDYPRKIPDELSELFFNLEEIFDNGITEFLYEIHESILEYYRPISPNNHSARAPLVLNRPPSIPSPQTSSNPNAIPLGIPQQ